MEHKIGLIGVLFVLNWFTIFWQNLHYYQNQHYHNFIVNNDLDIPVVRVGLSLDTAMNKNGKRSSICSGHLKGSAMNETASIMQMMSR